ncbi:hypothetical protein Dxin01_01912 [Deinococcus xinjiangensis]|uniref:Uncharacterized protein n=1 Tax=Deinococcus xinjiangensis TaxID=457454 RepID=A0ABP9VDM1_9DEIO
MKRTLSLLALTLGTAFAAPMQLGSLPVTVESSPKLLVLTDKGIRSAFPSAAGRPDAVFLSEDRKVTVAFEWRDGKLAPNEIDKLAAQYPAVIRAQVPNIKTLKAGTVEMNGKQWAQFVFTTPGQGDDLRREQLITSLGGRLFVVTVAAKVKDYSKNEDTIRALTGSIRLN